MTGVKLLFDCNLKGKGLYGKFVPFKILNKVLR